MPDLLIFTFNIFLLILLSAFFSSSETALTAVSEARIHELALQGNKRANTIEKILAKKEKMISTILIGNNLVNIIAPEHLEIKIKGAEKLEKKIINAGSIFLGEYSPEAIGDYLAGPNHVLPTSGSARFASGLSVNDFVKRTSLIKCSKRGIEKIGQMAINLANYEGLQAHAMSVKKRIKI